MTERDRADQDVITLLTHAFSLFMAGDPVGARHEAQMAALAVPASGPAQAALGDRLLSIDDAMGAEQALRTACDLGAGDADTLGRLARSLQAQGRLDEAADCFRQVLQLDPARAEACLNLGLMRLTRGAARGAVTLLRRAAHLVPTQASIRLLLAEAHQRAGGPDAAAAAETQRRAACALDPAWPAAAVALAESLVARGQVRAAQRALVRASRLDPGDPRLLSRCLHLRHLLPGQTQAALKRVHGGWQRRFGTPLPPRPPLQHRPGTPLRVGLVSPDLGAMPVGWLVRPLFRHRDPARLTLVALSDRPHDDAIARELQSLADHWEEVAGLGDEALAHRMRQLDLDILIDLSGHGPGNRLPVFARHRPAPIQVSWAGYPGDTGLRAIDLLVSDAVLTPPDDGSSPDAVARLATGATCYDPPPDRPDPGPAPRARTGAVTFGAFAGPARVGDTCLDLWAPVLRAVRGSRLHLCAPGWTDARAASRLRAGLRARNVDPARVTLDPAAGTPGLDRLQACRSLDVVLDTAPRSGHLVTLEALAMGVPVVTLPGASVGGRYAAAHLTHAGRPQGLAADADDVLARVDHVLTLPRTPALIDAAAWTAAMTTALEAAVFRLAADTGQALDDEDDSAVA